MKLQAYETLIAKVQERQTVVDVALDYPAYEKAASDYTELSIIIDCADLTQKQFETLCYQFSITQLLKKDSTLLVIFWSEESIND